MKRNHHSGLINVNLLRDMEFLDSSVFLPIHCTWS